MLLLFLLFLLKKEMFEDKFKGTRFPLAAIRDSKHPFCLGISSSDQMTPRRGTTSTTLTQTL